jgi:hypothetical protein
VTDSPFGRRLPGLWRDAVCALAVIAMVAHNHYNVRATRDVGADDEAWYVAGGALLGKPGFPEGANGWPIPELGALHCLSYFALSKVFPHPLELYYASWQLRTTLLALAAYVLVRRAERPWWQALAVSFTFVNSAIADVWPFPVHTAALVLLLGLVAATFTRTTTASLCVVTIALAFAGFCRPELLYAYGVAVAAFVAYVAREAARGPGARGRRWGEALLWSAAVIVPGALLARWLGNPLGGTRSFYAFAQHYTLELFEAEKNPLNPWASWGPVVARDFPGATTVSQAMRANPSAFLAHLGRNVSKLPANTVLAVIPLLDVSTNVARALLALGAGAALVQAARLLRDGSRHRAVSTALFAFACALVPFVLAILIVHPRLHYFVVVVAVGMTLVGSYPLPALRWRPPIAPSPRARVAGVIAACLLAVSLTATKSEAATLVEWLTHSPTKRGLFGHRQRASARLRALNLEGRVVALEYAWGTCFYAGYDCESYLRWDKPTALGRFLAERRVDVVIVDDEMLRDVRFVDDPDVPDFLAHPDKYGFEVERVEGTDVRIAVRAGRRR